MTKKNYSTWCQRFQINKPLFNISLLSLYAATLLQPSSSNAKPLSNKPPTPNRPPLQQRTFNNIATPVARLNDWRFYPDTLQLEFTLSAGITPRHFYLPQPPRIVVDLPDTKLGYVPTQQNYPGAIQSIRVSQLNAGVTRIVLDLAPGNFSDSNQLQLQPISQQNLTRWVLRPLIRGYSNSLQPGNYPQAPNNIPSSPFNYPQAPTNLPPGSFNYPPPSNLPPTNSSQQPFVTVPPLTPKNPTQLSNPILPPPNFPNQPSNFINLPPVATPNFPTPPVLNYPSNIPNTGVIEFGQPLPIKRY